MEAVDRIQQAAGGLEERMKDIDQQETAIDQLELKLAELTSYLIAVQPEPAAEVDLEIA